MLSVFLINCTFTFQHCHLSIYKFTCKDVNNLLHSVVLIYVKVPDVKPSNGTTKVVCSRFTSTPGILRSTYFINSSLNSFKDIFHRSYEFVWECFTKSGKKCQFHKEFEDTKGVNKIHKSKKNRQHNGNTNKKNKGSNNDLQNIHIKLKIE